MLKINSNACLKSFLLSVFLLICTHNIFAQSTKIGATAAVPNASAILDLDGVSGLAAGSYKGVLIPRMTFAQRTSIVTLAAVAQGLLVYQTDVSGASLEGFYYNISLTTTPNWVYLDGKAGWEITGNTNVTNANFIGTPSNIDFIVKTSGIAAANERMRVLRTGEVIVNNTVVGANAGDVFSVYSNNTTNGTGSTNNAVGAFAVNGYSAATGIGVYGENTGTGFGALGLNLGAGIGRGVSGGISSATGFGTEGYNVNATGTGIFGTGNGLAGTYLAGGSGSAFTGTATGSFALATTVASGTGVIGVGNNTAITTLAGGGGGAFNGVNNGSFGFASATTGIGVYGNANSATGANTGVQGQVASTTAFSTGVFGVSTAGSGAVYGVYGQTASTAGIGTFGIATSVTGTVIGVQGQSASIQGRAVRGFANTGLGAITASSYGSYGEVQGTIAGAGIAFGTYGITNATITTGDARGAVGVTSSNAGTGVFGSAASTTVVAAGITAGVWGQNAATSGLGHGVFGIASSNGAAAGVMGINNTAIPNGSVNLSTYGVRGTSSTVAGNASSGANQNSAFGVRGDVTGTPGTNSFAIGVRGASTSTTGSAYGVYGTAASPTAAGISGYNSDVLGTGLIVSGNGVALLQYLARGSGSAFTGVQYGVVGFATTTVNTAGNANAPANAMNGAAGGYFENQNAGVSNSWAYVGVTDNTGVNFKVIGNGAVGTMIKNEKGEYRGMTCPETPEILFQDYGQGQLHSGKAHITIDALLAQNINVNEKHPMRVFIQLRGDCKGVYVTNETAAGFDVLELQGGNSDTKFFWNIIANRADETTSGGIKSPYSDYRFNPAPGPAEIKSAHVLNDNNNRSVPTVAPFKAVPQAENEVLNKGRSVDAENIKPHSVEFIKDSNNHNQLNKSGNTPQPEK